VQLRFIGKPKDWELTSREHAALRQARERLGVGSPMPVTDGRGGRGAEDLDLIMDALRVLEEHGDEMPLPELADHLRVPMPQLKRALEAAWTLTAGVAQATALPDFELQVLADDLDSDGNDIQLPDEGVRVEVIRAHDERRPLRGRSLDGLGRFAYTAGETTDRLALVEAALAAHDPDLDAEALFCVRNKLTQWAAHLANRH